MTKTRFDQFRYAANRHAKFMVMVDFPTPPFILINDTVFAIRLLLVVLTLACRVSGVNQEEYRLRTR